jgi:hypothetical protein
MDTVKVTLRLHETPTSGRPWKDWLHFVFYVKYILYVNVYVIFIHTLCCLHWQFRTTRRYGPQTYSLYGAHKRLKPTPATLSLGGNADYSLRSRVEVKNAWSYTSLPEDRKDMVLN